METIYYSKEGNILIEVKRTEGATDIRAANRKGWMADIAPAMRLLYPPSVDLDEITPEAAAKLAVRLGVSL